MRTRKIVAGLFMSLDGVIEAPFSWSFPYMNDELSNQITEGIAQADGVLLGRRTYLEFAELWPNQGSDVPMADFLNTSPKYVVSATLRGPLTWANSSLLSGDLTAELTRLKRQPGKNILIPGSPVLVRSLLRDGLLDELSLSIPPVVLGSGQRLFEDISTPIPLQLVDSRTFSNGLLGVTYRPVPSGAPND